MRPFWTNLRSKGEQAPVSDGLIYPNRGPRSPCANSEASLQLGARALDEPV